MFLSSILLLTALSAISENTSASHGITVGVIASGVAMITSVRSVAAVVVILSGKFGIVSIPIDRPSNISFPNHKFGGDTTNKEEYNLSGDKR